MNGSRATWSLFREIETAAMEFVAAGLDLNGDVTGDGLTDFRVEVLVSNFGFLNGIEVRIHDDNSENGILVIGAVELKGRAAEVLAVDHNLLPALRVFRSGVAPTDELLRAGREQLEIREVAIQNRKIFDILFIEADCDVRAVGFDLRDFSTDFHGLGNCAQLQLRRQHGLTYQQIRQHPWPRNP